MEEQESQGRVTNSKSIPHCRGNCCHGFVLSVPLDRLREIVATEPTNDDAAMILDMLEPLPPSWEGEQQEYGCKHWDVATGLCTVYEKRPRICRSYGVDSPCQFTGCALFYSVTIADGR